MDIIQANNSAQIDFILAFKKLNDELSRIGQSLTLVCAGGYVMQLNGYRGTADIDAFYKSNADIESIIRKVGDECELNKPDELWLNNSIANMNPEPPDEYCELVYSFSNLMVKAVSIMYLIGMKLESGREQDLIDAGIILKNEKHENPIGLLKSLISMKFHIDISSILDVFEKAHGMEWLEEFYLSNQEELREFFS
jgi:hypothetical protein